MAKISPCFKKTFVFFNALFALFGIVIFAFALFMHQFAKEVNSLYAVISLYVIGSLIFIFAVLGAYGAYKESKCTLIAFFTLMCLATGGMLRLAVPMAVNRVEMLSAVEEYLRKESFKEMEKALIPIQEHFKCCGLFTGYQDWNGQVPESCNCVGSYDSNMCESISKNFWLGGNLDGQRVWSKPCGPLVIQYLDKVISITMAVLFSFAVLAILGSLMSLAMIIRITAPVDSHMPSFSLSYQPPKYSEVVNY